MPRVHEVFVDYLVLCRSVCIAVGPEVSVDDHMKELGLLVTVPRLFAVSMDNRW